LTIAIKYPAVRPASRRGLRFYIGSQLLEMWDNGNNKYGSTNSEAEYESPDIKMKWPCQWLTRLNGPLDPWTE
jgi:hypothetical protein